MSASLRSNTVLPSAVSLAHVSWRHAGRKAWALRDITLDVAQGERVLLLGASGSGKSTLLHAIAGLLRDGEDGESSGELRVAGQQQNGGQSAVGLVLQDPDAQLMMARVGDEVAFGCENLGVEREELWNRVRNALDAVGLRVPLDFPTAQLSGGQKQRLALAAALAMQPGVILLDEPTAMLDSRGIQEVRDALEDLTSDRSRTLIIVEHRIDTWLDLVDRVVVISDGALVADGIPTEVLASHREHLTEMGIWLPADAWQRSPQHSVQSTPMFSANEAVPGEVGDPEPVHQDAVIAARELSVGWNGAAAATVEELSVEAGTILAITAPNGAGKSTLALTLGGLLTPLSGHLTPNPNEWSSRALARSVGTVFQTPEQQFVKRTVRAELEFGVSQQALSAAEQDATVLGIAQRLRLEHLLDAHPFTLSGGEKRRLSVATALAARPQVLILDEPTFGQDAHTWRDLATWLTELRDEGMAIVVVTHDERFVAEVADLEFHLPSVTQHAAHELQSTAPPHEITSDPKPHNRRTSVSGIRFINPLAKLIASTILSVALILTLDTVSAGVALLCMLPLLMFSGLTTRELLVRLAPVGVAALLAGFTTVLYGQPSGQQWFRFGLIEVTEGSVELGVATALRVLAIAVPAVLLFTTIEPVDLADSLEQRTRLPARFIQGSLVALRLLAAVRDDWEALARARRSRGLGDENRITRFVQQAFALFVLSLRRADKLAIAMQSRAFDSGRPRSWARSSRWGVGDWMLILVFTAVALLATTAAIVAGTWHFALGGWS